MRVASPATVSRFFFIILNLYRCGMVYLMYEDLGWRPYVKSWIDRTFGPQESTVEGA